MKRQMLLSKGTKMRLENNISFKIVELMNNLKFSEIRGYQKLIVHMNDKKLSPCKILHSSNSYHTYMDEEQMNQTLKYIFTFIYHQSNRVYFVFLFVGIRRCDFQ